jgi:uncharacterized protein (TIGR02145 family)
MNKTAIIALLICTAAFAQQKGTFTDSRDGKKYKSVTIGKQTWMAENLNYNANGSKCYGNKPANCEKYGRLYDWKTAKVACPKGWHLPSEGEWVVLTKPSEGVEGENLKAVKGWNESCEVEGDDYKNPTPSENKFGPGNGNDKFGFTALPGGFYSGGSFTDIGDVGYWWSATESPKNIAFGQFMSCYSEYALYNYYNKSNLLSVRCLQD